MSLKNLVFIVLPHAIYHFIKTQCYQHFHNMQMFQIIYTDT